MAAELVAAPRQALVNVGETLSASFYDDAGTATDAGTVTVGIVGTAGDVIVASGTATGGSGTATRTYALGAQSTLDILTVTWTSSVYGAFSHTLEVVGALLFTIREARLRQNGVLSNTSAYLAAAIDEGRARILDEFENICNVGFVRRYRRWVASGAGLSTLYLPHTPIDTLRSIEYRASGAATWTAYTAAELADVLVDEESGLLTRETLGVFTTGTRNLRIGYEYGPDSPPLDIKWAALDVLVDQLSVGNLSQRIISLSSEFGTTQYSTPNEEHQRWYGMVNVDATLRRHRAPRPVVA